jgi:hypothetical protein
MVYRGLNGPTKPGIPAMVYTGLLPGWKLSPQENLKSRENKTVRNFFQRASLKMYINYVKRERKPLIIKWWTQKVSMHPI